MKFIVYLIKGTLGITLIFSGILLVVSAPFVFFALAITRPHGWIYCTLGVLWLIGMQVACGYEDNEVEK